MFCTMKGVTARVSLVVIIIIVDTHPDKSPRGIKTKYRTGGKTPVVSPLITDLVNKFCRHQFFQK